MVFTDLYKRIKRRIGYWQGKRPYRDLQQGHRPPSFGGLWPSNSGYVDCVWAEREHYGFWAAYDWKGRHEFEGLSNETS